MKELACALRRAAVRARPRERFYRKCGDHLHEHARPRRESESLTADSLALSSPFDSRMQQRNRGRKARRSGWEGTAHRARVGPNDAGSGRKARDQPAARSIRHVASPRAPRRIRSRSHRRSAQMRRAEPERRGAGLEGTAHLSREGSEGAGSARKARDRGRKGAGVALRPRRVRDLLVRSTAGWASRCGRLAAMRARLRRPRRCDARANAADSRRARGTGGRTRPTRGDARDRGGAMRG